MISKISKTAKRILNPIQLELIKKPDPKRLVVYCDGGSTCNVPARGYGNGYGSFQINGKIERRDFNRPMSANEAEILIILEALKFIKDNDLSRDILIYSDSSIAIDKVNKFRRPGKISKGASKGFIDACNRLKNELLDFDAKAEWKPRIIMVGIFGH